MNFYFYKDYPVSTHPIDGVVPEFQYVGDTLGDVLNTILDNNTVMVDGKKTTSINNINISVSKDDINKPYMSAQTCHLDKYDNITFDSIDMRNLNFEGATLKNVVFNNAIMYNVNLHQSHGDNVMFNKCDISRIKMSNSDYIDTCVLYSHGNNCDMSNSKWRIRKYGGGVVDLTRLTDVTKGTRITNGNWNGCDLDKDYMQTFVNSKKMSKIMYSKETKNLLSIAVAVSAFPATGGAAVIGSHIIFFGKYAVDISLQDYDMTFGERMQNDLEGDLKEIIDETSSDKNSDNYEKIKICEDVIKENIKKGIIPILTLSAMGIYSLSHYCKKDILKTLKNISRENIADNFEKHTVGCQKLLDICTEYLHKSYKKHIMVLQGYNSVAQNTIKTILKKIPDANTQAMNVDGEILCLTDEKTTYQFTQMLLKSGHTDEIIHLNIKTPDTKNQNLPDNFVIFPNNYSAAIWHTKCGKDRVVIYDDKKKVVSSTGFKKDKCPSHATLTHNILKEVEIQSNKSKTFFQRMKKSAIRTIPKIMSFMLRNKEKLFKRNIDISNPSKLLQTIKDEVDISCDIDNMDTEKKILKRTQQVFDDITCDKKHNKITTDTHMIITKGDVIDNKSGYAEISVDDQGMATKRIVFDGQLIDTVIEPIFGKSTPPDMNYYLEKYKEEQSCSAMKL